MDTAPGLLFETKDRVEENEMNAVVRCGRRAYKFGMRDVVLVFYEVELQKLFRDRDLAAFKC